MKNEIKYLEMWKTKKLVGWLDGLFDTCFLVFIWIIGWKMFFWFYMGVALVSVIGNALAVLKLEKILWNLS